MVIVDESSVIIAVAGMILEVFQWGKLLHCHDIELGTKPGTKAISSQPGVVLCLMLEVECGDCTKAIVKLLTLKGD